MRVTLKDVAVEAGIHHSAVSRVLRGRDAKLRLSPRRRQEIRDAATRLGYRPNSAAAATVSGKFNSIALVAGNGEITSTLPQQLVYGIATALGERDKQMIVTRMNDAMLTDETQMPLFLRSHSCDGVMINYTYRVPAGMAELLERYRIPSIWLNVKQPHDCVHPDDLQAGRDATRWLLGRGHKRIAYVDYQWPVDERLMAHYSSIDRFEGYKQAMVEASQPFWQVFPTTPIPREQRVDRLRDLLDRPDRPTAIISYGHEVAAALLAAASLGLQMPRDLDLVGFSETVLHVGGLPIPTMLVDVAEVGRRGVEEVLKKIENPEIKLPAIVVPFSPSPQVNNAWKMPATHGV